MLIKQRQHNIKNKSVFISCIVPVYNEQANVETFFPKLSASLRTLTDHFEIIVVDDGSHDKTIEKILQLPAENNIKLLGF